MSRIHRFLASAILLAMLALGTCLNPGKATSATILVRQGATTIQGAIDAATPGDEVVIADGLYVGAGNKNLTFRGKAITVRSANGAGSCTIDCEDNGRGFLFNSGEGATSVLEGITITNGYVSALGSWGADGGAVKCNGASPTLRGMVLSHNQAVYRGGGLCCTYGAAPLVTDCQFLDNVSEGGGAVICNLASAPTFRQCTFSGNMASSAFPNGGAVECFDATATFEDCMFNGNKAGAGGAVECGVAFEVASVAFTRCTFMENEAIAQFGGAVMMDGGSGNFTDCIFIRNKARDGGGAIACGQSASVTVAGCTLSGNSASYGAGLDARGSSSIVALRTIIAFSQRGEAVDLDEASSVTLNCCDLFGNVGGDWVGRIASQAGLGGNFSASPRFCNEPAGDLTLASTSPCLPGHHPSGASCGLIGAFGEGCAYSPTQASSWGQLKQRFGM